MNIGPIAGFEPFVNGRKRIVAEFENQKPALPECGGRLANQRSINGESIITSEQRDFGFVSADFALQRGRIGDANVRRIADNRVEALSLARKSVEKIRFGKMDSRGEAVTRGVALRDFEGSGGNIRREDLGHGQLTCERNGDAA